jgi:hypothetical protein
LRWTSNCSCAIFLGTLGNVTGHNILINRAPVLTLRATTVAERLGFDHDEALSPGKSVAGLNAQSNQRIVSPPCIRDKIRMRLCADGSMRGVSGN